MVYTLEVQATDALFLKINDQKKGFFDNLTHRTWDEWLNVMLTEQNLLQWLVIE